MFSFLGAFELKIFDSILGFLTALGKILSTMDYIVFGAVGLLFLSIFIRLIFFYFTFEIETRSFV